MDPAIRAMIETFCAYLPDFVTFWKRETPTLPIDALPFEAALGAYLAKTKEGAGE